MKIKNTLKIGAVFFIAVMLGGCAHKQRKITPPPVGIPTVLEGTWTYDCATDPDSQGNSLQQTQKYTGYQIVRTETSSKGLHCKKPLIESQITGTFSIGDAVDDHNNIDRTGHQIVVTIRDQATVDQANAGQLGEFGFGLTDWKLNEPKDLTSNPLADKYYFLDNTDHDIFKIKGNKLYSGDLNGDIVDNRPTTLDMSVWGTRK